VLGSSVCAHDSVYVVDNGGSRLSVFDPDLRYVHSAPVPHGATDATLTIRGFVVTAEAHGEGQSGAPFHLFDRIGNYRKSVGGGRTVIQGVTAPLIRWLTPRRGGGFLNQRITR
jgi:hypothetical protein